MATVNHTTLFQTVVLQLLYSPIPQRDPVATSEKTLLFLHGEFSSTLFPHRFDGPALLYLTAGVWGEDRFGHYSVDGDGDFPGVDVE